MNSEKGQEKVSCVLSKEVSSTIASVYVIGGSLGHFGWQEFIFGAKSVAKVWIEDPSVWVFIKTSHKKMYIVFMRETSQTLERFKNFRSCNPALAENVNHWEGIHKVEVFVICGQATFWVFDFAVEPYLFLQSFHKLFFFVKFKIAAMGFLTDSSILDHRSLSFFSKPISSGRRSIRYDWLDMGLALRILK